MLLILKAGIQRKSMGEKITEIIAKQRREHNLFRIQSLNPSSPMNSDHSLLLHYYLNVFI